MKRTLVTLAGVLVSLSAFGQGQVYFANKDSAHGINAPVYNLTVGGVKLDGTAYYAQLFGGPAGTAEDALQPCGDPVNFRTGTAAGYIVGSVVTIPGVGYDADAVVQMRAWSATAGNTWAEADYKASMDMLVHIGRSSLLTITTAASATDVVGLPGLVGLQSFSISSLWYGTELSCCYVKIPSIIVQPITTWGSNYRAPMTVPSGLSNVVAIATGFSHSLALTAEGRVVGWGYNNWGQTTVPSGLSNVVAIAARGNLFSGSSLVLTAEGQVVAWGDNYYGETTVPSGLSNVVAIAAGDSHSLALLRQPTVPTPRLELTRALSGLELQAHGVPGISCQLLHASRLPGPWLPAEPVTFTNSVQLLRSPDTSQPAQFFRLLRK